MAKDKDILNELDSLKGNREFRVPEGYFNELPERVLNRIIEEEALDKKLKKSPIIKLVWNQLAIAASFAALFLLSYTAIRYIMPDRSKDTLTQNEIYASLELQICDLDETYLYNLASGEVSENSSAPSELTDEEIITYLLEEGADLNLTTTDY
jgi:hypothetical protein